MGANGEQTGSDSSDKSKKLNLEKLALFVAIFSLAVAYFTYDAAKEANRIAEESRDESREANRLSRESIIISNSANELSEEANEIARNSIRPYVIASYSSESNTIKVENIENRARNLRVTVVPYLGIATYKILDSSTASVRPRHLNGLLFKSPGFYFDSDVSRIEKEIDLKVLDRSVYHMYNAVNKNRSSYKVSHMFKAYFIFTSYTDAYGEEYFDNYTLLSGDLWNDFNFLSFYRDRFNNEELDISILYLHAHDIRYNIASDRSYYTNTAYKTIGEDIDIHLYAYKNRMEHVFSFREHNPSIRIGLFELDLRSFIELYENRIKIIMDAFNLINNREEDENNSLKDNETIDLDLGCYVYFSLEYTYCGDLSNPPSGGHRIEVPDNVFAD